MLDYMCDHLEATLAALLLVARLGDLGSTYFVTPSLRLEANPVARRLGWKYAVATVGIAAVPFIPEGGIVTGLVLLIASLLVTSSNLRSAILIRGLGEARYAALVDEALQRVPAWQAYAILLISNGFFASVGVLLMFFYPDEGKSWAWWFAVGLIAYAAAVVFHHGLYYARAYARLSKHARAMQRSTRSEVENKLQII